MLQKPVLKPDFNKVADEVLKHYAAFFSFEQRKQKLSKQQETENVR